MAGGASFMAAPAIVAAQTPLKVPDMTWTAQFR
jgi:hypothetical protein